MLLDIKLDVRESKHIFMLMGDPKGHGGFVQKILSEKEWLDKMQSEDFRGLTPLFYSHVNPYGKLSLDLNERLMI
jgi:hypothetical protein